MRDRIFDYLMNYECDIYFFIFGKVQNLMKKIQHENCLSLYLLSAYDNDFFFKKITIFITMILSLCHIFMWVFFLKGSSVALKNDQITKHFFLQFPWGNTDPNRYGMFASN